MSNRILEKKMLAEHVFSFKIEAPLIARTHRAGQFVIVMPYNESERIPLTIANSNAEEGWIELIVQAVGFTTGELVLLGKGDVIAHLLGPLGRPTEIDKEDGPIICVGGGIGAAPLLPIVQALKAKNNEVWVILGARTSSLILLKEEFKILADRLLICTDDGSEGRQALVTEPLKEWCESTKRPSRAFLIGPAPMMAACAEVTKTCGIKSVASLNSIMIDGTGMCGGCRVTVGGQSQFVCVDGPEFDAHEIDWVNMKNRLTSYCQEEAAHRCRSNYFNRPSEGQ